MKNRIRNAFFASLMCLGFGTALAVPSPVRNVHDPTVVTVATAPPHIIVTKVVQQTDPPAAQIVFAAVYQALAIKSQAFDTADPAVIVLQSSTTARYAAAQPNTTTRVGNRIDTSVDTTAPPAKIDTSSMFTVQPSAIALSANGPAYGGSRNAEIV